jgi:hypothetical protein
LVGEYIILWVFAIMVYDKPEALAFRTKAECDKRVLRVESKMVEDGPDDGDMISLCKPITVVEPRGELQ